jgi:hypothetical protein
MQVNIPESVSRSINAGLVRANIDVSSSGLDVGYYLISKELGNTNTRFSESGILKRLGKAKENIKSALSETRSESDESSDSIDSQPESRTLESVKEFSFGKGDDNGASLSLRPKPMSVAESSAFLNNSGKVYVTSHSGVKNLRKEASLIPKDFSEGFKVLHARCVLVANKIGGQKAYARICTDGRQITGKNDLSNWWEAADCLDRLWLLTSEKAFPAENMNRREHSVIDRVPCPFRGTFY